MNAMYTIGIMILELLVGSALVRWVVGMLTDYRPPWGTVIGVSVIVYITMFIALFPVNLAVYYLIGTPGRTLAVVLDITRMIIQFLVFWLMLSFLLTDGDKQRIGRKKGVAAAIALFAPYGVVTVAAVFFPGLFV